MGKGSGKRAVPPPEFFILLLGMVRFACNLMRVQIVSKACGSKVKAYKKTQISSSNRATSAPNWNQKFNFDVRQILLSANC